MDLSDLLFNLFIGFLNRSVYVLIGAVMAYLGMLILSHHKVISDAQVRMVKKGIKFYMGIGFALVAMFILTSPTNVPKNRVHDTQVTNDAIVERIENAPASGPLRDIWKKPAESDEERNKRFNELIKR